MVAPPSILYLYIGLSFTPTAGVVIEAVILPSFPPLQVTSTFESAKPVIGVAAAKITEIDLVQFVVISLTVTVCVPAKMLVKFAEA